MDGESVIWIPDFSKCWYLYIVTHIYAFLHILPYSHPSYDVTNWAMQLSIYVSIPNYITCVHNSTMPRTPGDIPISVKIWQSAARCVAYQISNPFSPKITLYSLFRYVSLFPSLYICFHSASMAFPSSFLTFPLYLPFLWITTHLPPTSAETLFLDSHLCYFSLRRCCKSNASLRRAGSPAAIFYIYL